MTQNSAPVINPSDLAAIIGKAQGKGFTPGGQVRDAGDGTFTPASFSTQVLSRQNQGVEEPSQGPEPAAKQPDPAAKSPALKPVPTRDIEAEINAARAEGHQAGLAEGLAKGKAEAIAEAQGAQAAGIDQAREVFLNAAKALDGPDALISAPMAQEIERAILRLASERAGISISENPAAFQKRVAKMADRVAQGMREVKIALHPDDHDAVKDHLGGHEIIEGGTLHADDRLNRGDVVITGPSIRMADLLMQEEGAE